MYICVRVGGRIFTCLYAYYGRIKTNHTVKQDYLASSSTGVPKLKAMKQYENYDFKSN